MTSPQAVVPPRSLADPGDYTTPAPLVSPHAAATGLVYSPSDAPQVAHGFDVDARQHELSALLKADGTTRPELRPRDAPRPRHRSDGSYRWQSANLAATIGADGNVAFKDRPQVEYDGMASWLEGQPNDRIAAAVAPGKENTLGTLTGGLRFRFDLSDLLVGGTYNAERARFMDSTAKLRSLLALRERLCATANPARLREHLESIVQDSARSAEQKRSAVFDAFDACSESPLRKLVDRLISEFVQAHFPESSRDGFTAHELAALNERRIGGDR